MHLAPTYRICVICSGNICRSPMGEVILRSMLQSAGLGNQVVVDSAGTGGCHQGDPADPRTVLALKDHGYDGSHHRAREFQPEWFGDRDLVEHLRLELAGQSALAAQPGQSTPVHQSDQSGQSALADKSERSEPPNGPT